VVPCYNEAATIAAVVRAAGQRLGRVLVVDDGSTDDTSRLASEAGAEVVRLGVNQGKGRALATGLDRVREWGFAWAMTIDGDGQHDAADIPAFFAPAQLGSVSLVIGNRMGQAQRMPWQRRWINRAMSRMLSASCGQFLPDTQCGFRLLRVATWSELGVRARRFEVESEWLVAWLARGAGVAFVPVRTLVTPRRSRIAPLMDTVRWLRWFMSSREMCREASRRAPRVCVLPG